MKLKIISAIILCASMGVSYSGWYANTAHSRCNCFGFAESITWNWTEYHWWRVQSLHTSKKGAAHLLDTYMSYTWRSAAMDWGIHPSTDPYEWTAQGYHFYMRSDGKVIYDVYTQSQDCSEYDGWWETNKAKGE